MLHTDVILSRVIIHIQCHTLSARLDNIDNCHLYVRSHFALCSVNHEYIKSSIGTINQFIVRSGHNMAQLDSNAAGTSPTDHIKEDTIPQLIPLFQEQLQASAQHEEPLAALSERTLHDGNGQRENDDRARQHKTVNCRNHPILRANARLADFVG